MSHPSENHIEAMTCLKDIYSALKAFKPLQANAYVDSMGASDSSLRIDPLLLSQDDKELFQGIFNFYLSRLHEDSGGLARVKALLSIGISVPKDALFEFINSYSSYNVFSLNDHASLQTPSQITNINTIMSLLVASGADLHYQGSVYSSNHSDSVNPLVLCLATHGHRSTAWSDHLLSLGAHLEQCLPKVQQDFFKQAILKGAFRAIEFCQSQKIQLIPGYTPLGLAIFSENSDVFSALLIQGENPDEPSVTLINGNPFAYLSAAGDATDKDIRWPLHELLDQQIEGSFLEEDRQRFLTMKETLIAFKEARDLSHAITSSDSANFPEEASTVSHKTLSL